MYYLGLTLSEYNRLPIPEKTWYLERLQKELTPKDDSNNPTPQGPRGDNATQFHKNMAPEERAMMGMQRSHAPHRLQRAK